MERERERERETWKKLGIVRVSAELEFGWSWVGSWVGVPVRSVSGVRSAVGLQGPGWLGLGLEN